MMPTPQRPSKQKSSRWTLDLADTLKWTPAVLAAVALGWFSASTVLPPKPVAAVGFQLCGQLVGLGIMMSDGSRQELKPGQGEEAAKLLKRVPKANYHAFNVCPKVKEY
jgi:hypothetical protein